jgi:hypothetical protein
LERAPASPPVQWSLAPPRLVASSGVYEAETKRSADSVATRLALISGIPASGKTEFGRCLALEFGIEHLDLEGDGLDRLKLRDTWSDLWRLGQLGADKFVARLHGLGSDVIATWGYPPDLLPIVKGLHQAGLTAWWFDGDRATARRAFIGRGSGSLNDFDLQMAKIRAADPLLRVFYDTRIVETISADGTYVNCRDMYRRIFIE